MLGSKISNRLSSRRDYECRYATRLLALEKGKLLNQPKEHVVAILKSNDRFSKADVFRGSKISTLSKFSKRKSNFGKNAPGKLLKNVPLKDVKNKHSILNNHKQSTHVVLHKRPLPNNTLKACRIPRTVSIRRVKSPTPVILSSDESDGENMSKQYKQKPCTRTRSTSFKQSTPKLKPNKCELKKADSRSVKKAKALKLLRGKLCTGKKKTNVSSRELRPRFPYSPTQEWPTARAHRMASLNALAKVHILYENECRNPCSDSVESDEMSILELSCEEKSFSSVNKTVKKELKYLHQNGKDKSDKSSCKHLERTRMEKQCKKQSSKLKHKQRKKRRLDSEVEIIDTRICKRMASLNAQAILAASYLQEKPRKERMERKIEKLPTTSQTNLEIEEIIVESTCNVQIIESDKQHQTLQLETNSDNNQSRSLAVFKDDGPRNGLVEKNDVIEIINEPVGTLSSEWGKKGSEVVITENRQIQSVSSSSESNRTLTTNAVGNVGMTKYTEVTKVHINTTKEMEIKKEGKVDRKIDRIFEKDDVAITRMYHYQSKNSSQSYCLQMQTTYKPVSKNFSPSSSPISHSVNSQIHPHVLGPPIPNRENYYNYPSHSPVLTSSSYPINHAVGTYPSPVGIDHHISRQYGGSAFTVPHYGHPHMSYPHSYYQPAGPLIQPVHDPCLIHKPVPYHPQQHSHVHSSRHHATRPSPLPSHHPYSNEQCPQRHSLPQVVPGPILRTSGMAQPCSMEQTPHQHSSAAQIAPPCSSTASVKPLEPHTRSHQSTRTLGPRLQPHSCSPPQVYSSHNSPARYHCQSHNNSQSSYPHTQGQSYSPGTYPEYPPGYTVAHHKPSVAHQMLQNIRCHNNVQDSGCHHDQINSTLSTLTSDTVSPLSCPKIVSNMHSTKSEPLMPDRKSSQVKRYSSLAVCPKKQNKSDVCKLSYPKNTSEKCIALPSHLMEEVIIEPAPEEFKTFLGMPSTKSNDSVSGVSCLSHSKDGVNDFPIKPTRIVNDKSPIQPEIIEISDPDDCITIEDTTEDNPEKMSQSLLQNHTPDLMVIGVTKKKKEVSALIRRARLHGKQRTFRDSENRPLVPYSKIKRNSSPVQPAQSSKVFPLVSLPRLVLPKKSEKKNSNGWSWEGEPFQKLVYISNDDLPLIRRCYPSMRHEEGDIIKARDCVLLKSGIRKTDLPFVAKITALWENPDDGEMTMSLLWYYRPEHTEHGRKPHHMEDEIFASKHRDSNSVACIEDKCYVLTYGEYCRYRSNSKMVEECLQPNVQVVPGFEDYPRKERLPPGCVSPEMVFFCRKVYDFRQKRILKNPL